MPEWEQMTIALPTEMADAVRAAVQDGLYPTADDVIREALAEWDNQRYHEPDHATLKALIDEGLAAMEAGQVSDFNADEIVERGMKKFEARSTLE